MAGVQFFGIHRTWEDWLTMALGLVIGVSPWLTGQTEPAALMWNAVIVGLLVIAFGALELVTLQLWEEGAEILCGVWLIAAPFNLGYGGALATLHFVLGAAVILLAAVELLQDWKLSDEQLTRHGQ
jgi:hypothetical protein